MGTFGPDARQRPRRLVLESAAEGELHRALAIVLTLALAIRFQLPGGIPIGFVLACAALPVTFVVMRRVPQAGALAILCVLAMGSGLLLTLAASARTDWSIYLAVSNSTEVLSVAVGAITLLWARQVLGLRATVLTYGVGLVLNLAVVGIHAENPWKFSLSVPTILIVLSLPGVFGHRWREFVALLGLTGASVLSDSRSAAAMLLIAAALILYQGSRHAPKSRRTPLVVLQITAIGVAGYFAVQAALLEGMLGDAAQQRTEGQIQQSGSVLVGGRPEAGATIALIRENPLGIGSGTLVSYDQMMIAKQGMHGLGYDPNNGYVENYMFGSGYEVHSVIGDLWILFGVPGLLVAAVLGWVVLAGISRALSHRVAYGVVLYLALRTLWDLPFSPLPSALLTLAIALAVTFSLKYPTNQDRQPIRE